MNTKNYSVGVTGASGFLGAHLLQQLIAKEQYTLTAFSRHFPENMDRNVRQEKIDDICNNTNWQQFFSGLDCVIHTAARVHIMNDNSVDALEAFRRVNLYATVDIARAAANAGVKRFIFISSIKVNGEETQLGNPFLADHPPAPKDPYGISKMEAEIALRDLAVETGMEVVIIRPVLVYGPGVKANFLNLMKLLERGLPLPFGSIHNKRSLVSLDNLVSLIVTCIAHPNAANQTFLVSDGEDLSTTELLTRMARALQRPLLLLPISSRLIEFITTLLGRPAIGQRLCRSLQVDISKTQTLLDWTPEVTVNNALEKTARHFQENH